LIIPGKPLSKIFAQLRGVFLKSNQIMEGVDPVEGAGMNETHEQIPDVSPVLSLEEEAALLM
jgi:hypothetical protein